MKIEQCMSADQMTRASRPLSASPSPSTSVVVASRRRLAAVLVVLSLGCGAAQLMASQPGLAEAGPDGTARFDRVTDALAPQPCSGAGCWSNHLRVTDLDGDGDLDILIANYPDFFQGNDSPQPLVVYENDGSGGFTDVSTAAVGDYSGNLRQVAVGDVNGDGGFDIYGPDGHGNAHVLFINDGSGVFTDQAASRLPTDYPSGAAARMGDVDNDGDLDIFAADGYATAGPLGHLYINDGMGFFTEAVGAIPLSMSGSDINDVELFDADGDFDLDLVVNAHNGGTGALWLNDGTGVFAAGGAIDPPATGNFHYNVTPCDVDSDGDLDLWIDNIGGDWKGQLLINDGLANFDDQTATRVTDKPDVDDNGIVCTDVDNDGDLDAVVVSLGTPERLLENDGSGNFTYVEDVFEGPTDCSLWSEFGDLDGDGRIDLVTGQGECSSSNEVYLANSNVAIDTRAPVIRRVEQLSAVSVGVAPALRFAVSDSTVTDQGPRLERAYVVIDPAGLALEVDAEFVGGDLFRSVLPAASEGVVTFRACAEDLETNVACSADQTYEVIESLIFADGFESGDTVEWSGG